MNGIAGCEVAVVGSGPVGLTAALALAGAGFPTAVIGRPRSDDNRTTALLASSIAALETLGVWDTCREHAAPLRTLRIVDDTRRLWRAPEVRFESEEIGLPAFAHNIENRHLVAALETVAANTGNLHLIEDEAASVSATEDRAHIRTASGADIEARLVVGADGRDSICREAAGIRSRSRRYPQIALTFNVAHSRPHNGTSTEFHTEAGPFTIVPLPGNRSSIVCVVHEREVEHLRGMSGAPLDRELERRAHSIVGEMQTETQPGIFPLAVESAERLAAQRIALVGEAAHRIPPIGAQGLNLGLRDAATIAEVAAENRRDPGAASALQHYEEMRRADVMSRMLAVDLLNRSLLSGFLPMQGLRGLGLYMLNTIGPVRRALMREGVTPRTSQPRLMRGEALR